MRTHAQCQCDNTVSQLVLQIHSQIYIEVYHGIDTLMLLTLIIFFFSYNFLILAFLTQFLVNVNFQSHLKLCKILTSTMASCDLDLDPM